MALAFNKIHKLVHKLILYIYYNNMITKAISN